MVFVSSSSASIFWGRTWRVRQIGNLRSRLSSQNLRSVKVSVFERHFLKANPAEHGTPRGRDTCTAQVLRGYTKSGDIYLLNNERQQHPLPRKHAPLGRQAATEENTRCLVGALSMPCTRLHTSAPRGAPLAVLSNGSIDINQGCDEDGSKTDRPL